MGDGESGNYSEKACFYAEERYKSILLWRNLWSILLFIFGTAIIILVILLLYMAVKGASVELVLSVLATAVDGIAIKWVLARRKDAVNEEVKAYEIMKRDCPEKRDSAIDLFKDQLRLFGKFR